MTQKTGVGILGCGNISAAYMRMADFFSEYKVVACADLNMDAAKARADEFNLRADTIDDLLAADDIEVIVNLTIPAAHYEVSKRILEAGKSVYSEKPYVLTLDEGSKLAAIAKSNGVRIGSAPDTFLGASHQQARALIDGGKVGKILSGTCYVMGHGMEDWHPNPDFFYQEGAGPVLDIGPYYVTNLVQLLGPVEKVAALSATPFKTRTILSEPRAGEEIPVTTPTTITALMQFKSGAQITLSTSWDVWAHNHPNTELYGETGSLFIPDPNFFGADIKMTDKGDAVDVPATDHPFGVVNDDDQANYRGAGLADMCAAIREGRDHRCNDALALHVVEVMTAILRSGETGQFEILTTTCERPAPLDADAARALIA